MWSFLPWVRTSDQPGAHGDMRSYCGYIYSSSSGVPPFRSAHCIRISSDHGETWSTAMGSGRRHRKDAAEGAARQDPVDFALRPTPWKQDCRKHARVFSVRGCLCECAYVTERWEVLRWLLAHALSRFCYHEFGKRNCLASSRILFSDWCFRKTDFIIIDLLLFSLLV